MGKTDHSNRLNKIETVEEGVIRFFDEKKELLPVYEIVEGKRYKVIKWQGKSAPLFSFCEHPKIINLTAKRELLGKPCAMSAYSVDNASLDTLLFRELVIAEKCFQSEVVKVTLFRNGPSATALIKFANDGTYHVNLHAADFGEKQFKHEFFNTEGMIANRAVDTVIAQQALNIYTKDGYEYVTDNHYILYGLTPDEVNEVVCIYATLTKDDSEKLNAQAIRLNKIVDIALEKAGKCIVKGEDF